MTNHYDYIIAGGGLAGLSLAYAIAQSPDLQDKKVLIIDREAKKSNDRTWSFWAAAPTMFDHIAHRTWKKINFVSDTLNRQFDLTRYRYSTIRGIDFYREVNRVLQQAANISFTYGEITEVGQEGEQVYATVNGQRFTGNYLFDSLFRAELFSPYHADYHYIRQHFKGYVIRTPQPFFDDNAITMFDFRTEQKDGVYFFYILPYANNLALVEYTGFSRDLLPEAEYDQELRDYIHNRLQLTDYEIEETEFAVIPMTDYRFESRKGRIVRIGVQGGMSKPSTGYAFIRIQRQVERIVKSLRENGTPFYKESYRPQFRVYDAMLLNIMHREGWKIAEIFSEMFRNNPIERVLRFLDEQTHFGEDLLIMASVPPMPFLQSIRNLFFSRKPVKKIKKYRS
ncbi:lycopene cyclase family protein [Rhodoflexus caldus]|uniref:lycopene cyclase family protein n=1 Tax=Rhodoflexus caldus TaxID=2891236 RepID=UPI00202A9808|nr:lycopene cyclase family protein [Rhodoflexus caldus]